MTSRSKVTKLEPWMTQRLKEGVERRIAREYAESLGIKTTRRRRRCGFLEDYDEEWERELWQHIDRDEW